MKCVLALCPDDGMHTSTPHVIETRFSLAKRSRSSKAPALVRARATPRKDASHALGSKSIARVLVGAARASTLGGGTIPWNPPCRTPAHTFSIATGTCSASARSTQCAPTAGPSSSAPAGAGGPVTSPATTGTGAGAVACLHGNGRRDGVSRADADRVYAGRTGDAGSGGRLAATPATTTGCVRPVRP